MHAASTAVRRPYTIVSIVVAFALALAASIALTTDPVIGFAVGMSSLAVLGIPVVQRFPWHALAAYIFIAPWVYRHTEIELGSGVPNLNFERLGIYGVSAIVFVRIVWGQTDRLRLTRFDKAFLMLIGLMMFSGVVMGRTPPQTFRQVVNENVYPFAIYFGMKHLVSKPSQVRIISLGIMLTGLAFGIHAFADQVLGMHLGKIDKHALAFNAQRAEIGGLHNLQENRAAGPMGNSVVFGVSLIIGAVVSFFTFLTEKSRLVKVVALVTVLFCAIGILVTYTRSVYVATALCVPLLWLWYPNFRKAITTAVILGIICFVLYIPVALSDPDNRMFNTGSILERFGMWYSSFYFIKASPILGHGYGFQTYPTLKHMGLVPKPGWISYHYVLANTTPHNEFLRMWITMGIPGVALFCRYLWTMAGELRAFRRVLVRWNLEDMRLPLLAAGCGMIGFYGQGFFTDMTAMNYADTVVFLYLGSVLGVYEHERRRRIRTGIGL